MVLAGMGAAGATLVSGCWPSSDKPTADHRTKEPAIFELSFDVIERFRPFHLVAPGFVAATHSAVGEVAATTRADQGPPAPFAAVEVQIVDAGSGQVFAGLASADGEHVAAVYDAARERVAISVRQAGRTRLIRRRKVDLPQRARLAFAVCENQVTVLTDTGDGWCPVLTERDRVAALVDLRDPTVLDDLRYTWGAASAEPVTLGDISAGLFGMTGLRDPHLVQHSDGRPYVRDGKAYLTCTCAGLGVFQQAHWGVFTLDLADPTRLEQVAQLYSFRDGLLLGDHAGQIVRDEDDDCWIVATSSWGDFAAGGVHARHTSTTSDVLSGVHLLETEPTPLPTMAGSWDPAITKIDGRWYVAFVESPSQKPFDFHPALARGPQGAETWHQDLELVGAAVDLHQCEGPILQRVAGRWWLLASDGDNRLYPVYNLDMHRVGRLDAPYPTNIPHPQVVPLPEGGHLMVSFNGTQYAEKIMRYGGHGDVVVMKSS